MRTLLITIAVLALALPSSGASQARPVRAPAAARDSIERVTGAAPRAPASAPTTTATTESTTAARTRTAAPSVRRNPGAPIGTYLATRIDRDSLPLEDKVVDEDGTLYLIAFDRLILTLRDDLTFRASVRYRRTLFAAAQRGRGRATPLQTMAVTGTYVMNGGEIRFTPDPTSETRGLRMLAGTVRSARELSIPFNYRNGTQERDRTLIMSRRDNIL